MDMHMIKEIAGELDLGMRCFVHLTTKEIKVIPKFHDISDLDTDVWNDDIEEIEKNQKEYLEVKGLESNDSFRVMRDFVETVDNEHLKRELIDALGRPKPFRNFRFVVDNSGEYRDRWFKFKENYLVNWVEKQLEENKL